MPSLSHRVLVLDESFRSSNCGRALIGPREVPAFPSPAMTWYPRGRPTTTSNAPEHRRHGVSTVPSLACPPCASSPCPFTARYPPPPPSFIDIDSAYRFDRSFTKSKVAVAHLEPCSVMVFPKAQGTSRCWLPLSLAAPRPASRESAPPPIKLSTV